MVKQTLRLNQGRLFLLTTLFAICLLALWFIFGELSLFNSTYYSPRYSTTAYPLTGNAKVTQDFEAQYPGLYQIDLYISNSEQEKPARLALHLKDSCQASEDIETTVVGFVPSSNIQLYSFTFSPIENSAGRKFCVVLEASPTQEAGQLSILASQADVYPWGTAKYKANTLPLPLPQVKVEALPAHSIWLPLVQKQLLAQDFDLGFMLHYRAAPLNTLIVLLEQLAAYKPGLFGKSWFYLLIFVSYALYGLWVGRLMLR